MTYELIGENPLIWDINSAYVDPGVDMCNNVNISVNITNVTNINIEKVGAYYYKYNINDGYNVLTLSRIVYILDYTVLEHIPVINIADGSNNTNNITNILKLTEYTNYFKNNELLLTNKFAIEFKNKNETYCIPIDELSNMYNGANNMIMFMYGITNEVVSIINTDANATYMMPYITNEIVVRKLVNLILNNDNNYKLIVIDGKHSNLLDSRDPILTLDGPDPFNVLINTPFVDPGSIATSYKGSNISVNMFNNIKTSKLGSYNSIHIATDISGYQTSKLRKVNIVDTLELNYSLLGDAYIIWNLNEPYVDAGIDTSNIDINLLTIVTDTNINVSELGTYYYRYTITDENNYTEYLVRQIVVLEFTVLEHIPIIHITENSIDNVTNILKSSESSSYFKDKSLLLSDDFAIQFTNKNETYRIPLDGLTNMYDGANNMIVFVYALKNEVISIVNTNDSTDYKFPYITNELIVKKMVNLVLNNDNNYKLIVIDGKKNYVDTNNPIITLLGNNPYQLPVNSTFVDPGATAKDYNNVDITDSIVTSTNLDSTAVGDYTVLYIANDTEGNQDVKSRDVIVS